MGEVEVHEHETTTKYEGSTKRAIVKQKEEKIYYINR